MKAEQLIKQLKRIGIRSFAGVPDSTLKVFCDYMNHVSDGEVEHCVTVDEGGALALAIGSFLGAGKFTCVYMQNSGIGNIVNPLTSLANKKVYGVPMLFLIGWRGEPGIKDEPQHAFMGEITLDLLSLLEINYKVVDKNTTDQELENIISEAETQLNKNLQYAIVVKAGTFEAAQYGRYENKNILEREKAIRTIVHSIDTKDVIVSTTGKISREVYEQSNDIYGNHNNAFLTVGGMGYASMIAYGIAAGQVDKRVYCIDGDGAALMHMGNLAFIGNKKPSNYIHICLNNYAHESVGGMPTAGEDMEFHNLAAECGYQYAAIVHTDEELKAELEKLRKKAGPIFLEVKVNISSRENLGRPKELPVENKIHFMENL